MEVALLSKNSFKIKGKNSAIVVDPQEKIEANAAIALLNQTQTLNRNNFEVIISGPGEYETGGIKISGTRGGAGMVFSTTVDSVSISFGTIQAIEKLQSKLKEPNILIAYCDEETEASFLTSNVSNVIILYGEKSEFIAKSISGESFKKVQKYANTIDKLPTEIETIILE